MTVKVAIHDYGGYPFTIQLARALAVKGHDALYLYSSGLITPKGAMDGREGDEGRLSIEPVGLADGRATRRAGARRLLQERQYGTRLAARIRSWGPDVVMSANTPLPAQAEALRATHLAHAAFVFWLQDIHSQAIARLVGRRIPIAGRLIGSRFERMERDLLRGSDAVVAVSEDFIPFLTNWDIPEDMVTVQHNWAPLDEVRPLPKSNPWSQLQDLDRASVLLYSGTLGRKHDPSLLVALADGLPDARVVVVSEGTGTERLRGPTRSMPNLTLLPLQPIDRLPEVLGSADVLLAILDPEATVFSVPSKVLTYLAAGRPILAAIPAANLAARAIQSAGAGLVVDPMNADAFVVAARAMISDPAGRETMGQAAREHAEREFSIGPIADRFESVLLAAVQLGHSKGSRRADTAGAR
jgi:glycosyltransferase involved in cell wall biosynthesis